MKKVFLFCHENSSIRNSGCCLHAVYMLSNECYLHNLFSCSLTAFLKGLVMKTTAKIELDILI